MNAGTQAEPQRLRLRVDGRQLEVVRFAGASTHAPLVLLHEGLGSVAMWRGFPAALRDVTDRTVVAYSRHGYGESDALRGARDLRYMHREGEVVLPALLAQLGVQRAVLFGHSDGASIALIAAGCRPAAVEALVLEAPHVFVEDCSLRSIARARSQWETTDLRQRLARYHADPDGAFRGWNDVWLDPRFRTWNIEAYADSVTCPILVVQGDGDEYGTLEQVAAIVRRSAHVQTLIVPGAGHSPHREAAADVLERVRVFLASLAAPAG